MSNYTVIFEYSEYSDTGDYLGVNQDHSDVFDSKELAEYHAQSLLDDGALKAWVTHA